MNKFNLGKYDLLSYQDKLSIRKESTGNLIWDPLRRKFLLFTPEEMVRQLCLHFLLSKGKYPQSRFNAEKELIISGRKYRYDLLLYSPTVQPWMLIECKAPGIRLSNLTFEQISNYNRELEVPYLVITNGPDFYCVQIDWKRKTFRFLSSLPEYPKA